MTNPIGHFGTVYLARAKRAEDFLLVLKCLEKDHIEASGSQTQVRREIEVGLSGYTLLIADHEATEVDLGECSEAERSGIPISYDCMAGSMTRLEYL